MRQAKVDAVTAPFVIDSIRDYARPNRIQVDVADQLQKLAISVDQEGFIAPLKNVSDPRVAPIDVARITETQVMHDLR